MKTDELKKLLDELIELEYLRTTTTSSLKLSYTKLILDKKQQILSAFEKLEADCINDLADAKVITITLQSRIERALPWLEDKKYEYEELCSPKNLETNGEYKELQALIEECKVFGLSKQGEK